MLTKSPAAGNGTTDPGFCSWVGMWSPEAPRGLCDAPVSKENILLHCYSAGTIQALLSACRGAVTAEITCAHKALSALHRESLALNPVHCLGVYSLFNYMQGQVSTVTDTIPLCKSMRQHYKGRRVFPENLCCSKP